ncbi:hypothetical protein A1F94_002168 [Pyrenophora tritici-repentis]|nr:hypothetical protein PtrV1_02772 [Pyrenophora tritici-repentis]KAF7455524.1 hypothetical protein A1F99_027820 [Pyrenophora tritici-repentis]KAG9389275.1 hypothetical protein A1F94_002168 [Pyrenophora tritici-repentis]KAI0588382.1 hypothetical protein Alg130_03402 [Pyrenophora tritici-repentis]KAI0624598.1 hypothetical protein TUN199_03410 [Pyrenophora tritici-repentis]
MRPDALDAATTKATHKSMHSSRTNSPAQQQVEHHNNSRTPIVSTDGTFSPTDNTGNEPASAASILVSEVVQSVKTAVDDALTWAENKVDGLHPGQESAGPYTSPATCILNYKWAQTGIYDVYDKGIAGILVGMMAAAGGAYWRSNDKPTAMVLGFVAILQALGVRNGWYDRFA